jgi:hypothetical protein
MTLFKKDKVSGELGQLQFEEANDLLIGKSGLFHSRYSPKLADFVPSLWYGREGAGHCR